MQSIIVAWNRMMMMNVTQRTHAEHYCGMEQNNDDECKSADTRRALLGIEQNNDDECNSGDTSRATCTHIYCFLFHICISI